MLLGHESSQLVSVLFQEGLVFEHIANPLRYGDIFPCLERVFGVRYGGIELVFRRHRYLGDDILSQWAFNIEALRSPRFDPSAVDVIFILNTQKKD